MVGGGPADIALMLVSLQCLDRLKDWQESVNRYFDSGKIRLMKTTPYHHGALKEALVAAAEAILRRDGLSALTLRAAAREAGVSHAAPSHHFGDLTGLLSELAADGFRRFGVELQAAMESAAVKRWDGARAYLAFARQNPELFQLFGLRPSFSQGGSPECAWATRQFARDTRGKPDTRTAGEHSRWLVIDSRLYPAAVGWWAEGHP